MMSSSIAHMTRRNMSTVAGEGAALKLSRIASKRSGHWCGKEQATNTATSCPNLLRIKTCASRYGPVTCCRMYSKTNDRMLSWESGSKVAQLLCTMSRRLLRHQNLTLASSHVRKRLQHKCQAPALRLMELQYSKAAFRSDDDATGFPATAIAWRISCISWMELNLRMLSWSED